MFFFSFGPWAIFLSTRIFEFPSAVPAPVWSYLLEYVEINAKKASYKSISEKELGI